MAFSTEQKEDFPRIMSGYKGDSDLLKDIEKMYDPKDPKPLKIKDINDFLAKDNGRSLMLIRSLSRALNDKDHARKEHRTNLALLMTDDKAIVFVMTKRVRGH